MKFFEGVISAGDVFDETLTIKCHKGISGAEMGKVVIVIPMDLESLTSNEWDQLVSNFRTKYKKKL